MGLGGKKDTAFQNHLEGYYGTFGTPAGRVDYILTKARLGKDGADSERRLTSHLAPVREVLQSDDLDFNQLLQRDLDDHRVAVNLIPYILKQNPTGPAFFPPIVAVLLPFENKQPTEFAPLELKPEPAEDSQQLAWIEEDAGSQARIRRLAMDDGSLHHIKLGQLWWNSEYANLVVLDGQHRAMALLAIDRTVRKAWAGSAGERYRYFYEARVKALLHDQEIDLERIEVPVAVVWLPELFGPGKRPHIAARKLFVDVNKEARTPSESRLILLSDSELVNIFTRGLLSKLRNDKDGELLPLFAVEYDSPEAKASQSSRWSAMTNVHMLRQMTKRMIFGPDRYQTDVGARIAGRESSGEMDALMRLQLNLAGELDGITIPQTISDDGFTFKREEIGNQDFPMSQRVELERRFLTAWGAVILEILSNLTPYKAHAEALTSVRESWATDNSIDRLAYDALFGGVGMYWTLRDSNEHFRNESADVVGTKPTKPDIVKAWEAVVGKQADFETLRAGAYLGKTSKKSVDATNSAFAMFNTHACQVGLALTAVTLWRKGAYGSKDLKDVEKFGKAFVLAINAWLKSKPGATYDRRLFLNRKGDFETPFNVIASLDAPRAVEFRYFWLEVLASAESQAVQGDAWNQQVLLELRDKARRVYLQYVIGQHKNALKVSKPSLSDAERQSEAVEHATKELRKALHRWFGIPAAAFESWTEAGAAGTCPRIQMPLPVKQVRMAARTMSKTTTEPILTAMRMLKTSTWATCWTLNRRLGFSQAVGE